MNLYFRREKIVFALAIFLEDPTKKQYDIQHFSSLGFNLKVVALKKHRNAARLFFLNLDDPDKSDMGMPFLDEIKVLIIMRSVNLGQIRLIFTLIFFTRIK